MTDVNIPQKHDIAAVKKDILGVLSQPNYDDGSAGPVLLRLAWHASGTYDVKTKTGGSDGAGMRYEAEGGDPANAGLQHARVFLEPIKSKYPWISYSDLWTLAGVTALEAMGGPSVPWKAGRTDFTDDGKCPPRGRLPDASKRADHLRDVFYRQGFNDREIVALSGAHAVGRCHSDRSGYEGPWTSTPTKFGTQYFKLLTKFKWEPKEWTGPFQYRNDDMGEELMMLPTDLALIEDPAFRPWVEAYADDRELFFADFAAAFGKMLENGVARDDYTVAPKKSDAPGAPGKGKSVGRAKL